MTSRVLAPNSSEKSPRILESTNTKSNAHVQRSAGAGGPPAAGVEKAQKGRAKAMIFIATIPITPPPLLSSKLSKRGFSLPPPEIRIAAGRDKRVQEVCIKEG